MYAVDPEMGMPGGFAVNGGVHTLSDKLALASFILDFKRDPAERYREVYIMANTIFFSEGALLFIMVATVALGFWLQRFKVFKTLGPALTVIVMGIVMSNL